MHTQSTRASYKSFRLSRETPPSTQIFLSGNSCRARDSFRKTSGLKGLPYRPGSTVRNRSVSHRTAMSLKSSIRVSGLKARPVDNPLSLAFSINPAGSPAASAWNIAISRVSMASSGMNVSMRTGSWASKKLKASLKNGGPNTMHPAAQFSRELYPYWALQKTSGRAERTDICFGSGLVNGERSAIAKLTTKSIFLR